MDWDTAVLDFSFLSPFCSSCALTAGVLGGLMKSAFWLLQRAFWCYWLFVLSPQEDFKEGRHSCAFGHPGDLVSL